MKQREVLEVVVRTIGILLMVSWVFALITAIFNRSAMMTFYAFMMFATGGYLLKGAPRLLDWGFDPGREPLRESRASSQAPQPDGASPRR